MNAIVPLNVNAIRVNENDAQLIVSGFKGRTALFEDLPYSPDSTVASTGDTIHQALDSASTPANPLGAGVHVHWELPDHFRRGKQSSRSAGESGGQVVFPHAPNRWLVVRYLSPWDTKEQKWGAAQSKSFLVESDYVSQTRWDERKPGVSVPLAVSDDPNAQPFQWMGRVLDYEQWDPAKEKADEFLPYYKDANGQPYYLTSIGFVGPGFASFYPECNSVFGFWDTFADQPAIQSAIANNTPLQFRVSYQVVGWINEQEHDPLRGIEATVTQQYNDYVAQQNRLKLAVTETPADFFVSVMRETASSWVFNKEGIHYTLNADKTLKTLVVPAGTLCSGLMQEVVWNMLDNPGTTYFLNNPESQNRPSGTWTDRVEVAIGNNTAEALSALLKKDLGAGGGDPDWMDNYEYLLNALQAGLLRNLEAEDNRLILLDEVLHTRSFSSQTAGLLWNVQTKDSKGKEVTLPLDLAERLALLNEAQKNYDQAWAGIETMTKQLFMDWIRYVKMYVSGNDEPYLTWQDIQNFLDSSSGGELQAVVGAIEAAGMVRYLRDDTGRIIGMDAPKEGHALVNTLYHRLQDSQQALKPYPNLELLCTTAPKFELPEEPVMVVEGERIEPVRRNGASGKVLVRLSEEVLDLLLVEYGGERYRIPAGMVEGIPVATAATPMRDDVQAQLAEAFLLVISLAPACATALQKHGKSGNPAEADYDKFVASLSLAQGGFSPLENSTATGLYAALRAAGYKAAANPVESVEHPMEIQVTFTNAASTGWAPDAVGWNAQSRPGGFPESRVDPFLPMYMIWQVRFRPLKWDAAQGADRNYGADNLTNYFELNTDEVDYRYKMSGDAPADFTIATPSTYTSSVVLSKKPVTSLTSQIDLYLSDYPNDPVDPALIKIKEAYEKRRIMAQTMSGFNVRQTLRDFIPQITVENLPLNVQDQVTLDVQKAARTEGNWYSWAFNSVQPMAREQPGFVNFGPMRAGFLQVMELTIIDVFGQVMQLSTPQINADKSLQTIASYSMQPRKNDKVNADWIYLPPRLLAPARVWFRWFSALHDEQVPGIDGDFVEMTDHPASSPVCGWILPNHLDGSLFFYEDAGSPIGSFGIEADAVKYRTRAGNRSNPRDELSLDIGEPGHPTVNPHLANVMWWIYDRGKGDVQFLRDLMAAILHSDTHINPKNFAQNATLSVLIGRPLAITRAVLGLETPGELLPLSQLDNGKKAPFPQDVLNHRVKYGDRQAKSSADLGEVKIPVRLGDLVNMDDGLLGYLIEGSGANPYGTFYSSSASNDGEHGVVQPSPTTIELTLNDEPLHLTMLVDPRAGVHATTGLLPVEELAIPVDQYGEEMSGLAMTFFSNPILRGMKSFVVPVPQEQGYDWSWIDPATDAAMPLEANAATEFAIYGYTPQTVQEGWLELRPNPDEVEGGE